MLQNILPDKTLSLMEVGQSDRLKIGAIIQARMLSTRMPGKVLMPLPFPDGPPVLARIVESLKKINRIRKIIIATSTNKENDSIEKYCIDNRINVYRGDEKDVQSRFINLIKEYGFDHIIRLTGDNPIIDSNYLEKTLDSHIKSNSDYTKTSGLPLGTNFEVVKSVALTSRVKFARTQEEKEHVTYHLARSKDTRKNFVSFSSPIANIRLTIDYPEDYAMLTILFQHGLKPLTLENVQKIVTQLPWIKEVNSKMIQKDY